MYSDLESGSEVEEEQLPVSKKLKGTLFIYKMT